MQGRLLLYVIVAESSPVFELFSGKDESLLVRRNSFLVLDLLFDVFDGVARLAVEGDGFACEGFYKNLHCLWCCYKARSSVYGGAPLYTPSGFHEPALDRRQRCNWRKGQPFVVVGQQP